MAAKKVNVSGAGEDMIGEYVKSIALQAEELVMVKFPQMAKELDEFLKASHFYSGKTSVHNELKMLVSDSDSWNRNTDGFISKMMQKLAVSSDSLTSFSDHLQCNKNTRNAENFATNGILSTDNDVKLQTPDLFSRNLNIDEYEKLKVLPDSVLCLTDERVQCHISDADNSEHKESEMPIPYLDSMNQGTEYVSKEQKPAVASDLELSLTDRIRCKKHIVDIIQLMKAISSRLLEDIQFLKMWIQFLTPRKEDADSLIESILNDILLKIEKVETKTKEFSRQFSRYFYVRSLIVKRYTKYPQVNDFESALQENDEEYYCEVRYSLCEYRNFYATLHDMISKNIKELKKSRTFNPSIMY